MKELVAKKYDKSEVIVNESDAEIVLLTTKTLTKYAEKLLRESVDKTDLKE